MLDALIVEPALENRTHLRELARDFCKSVVVSSSLQDGLERVRNLSNCDVIYVSSRFNFESAKEFVGSTKKIEAGRDSANLLIGSQEDYTEAFLAKLSLNGFDGVLVEPASVDTFRVSAEIALKARKEKLKLRTKKSVEILSRALASQLDELYMKKKSGYLTFLTEEKLRNLGKEVARLDAETLGLYLEALVDYFPNCAAPNILETDIGSASQRVQRRRLTKSS